MFCHTWLINNIQSEEFKFPGHTDYLDQELEVNALMLIGSRQSKSGLLKWITFQ